MIGALPTQSHAAIAGVSYDVPKPCQVDECKPTVIYDFPAGTSGRMEVDFDHQGAPDLDFVADRSVRCRSSSSAVGSYANPGPSGRCELTARSVYREAVKTTIAVRVTTASGVVSYDQKNVTVKAMRVTAAEAAEQRKAEMAAEGCKGTRADDSMYGGPGNDHIVAYYGHGTIDCGPGKKDLARVRKSRHAYKIRNCEQIRDF